MQRSFPGQPKNELVMDMAQAGLASGKAKMQKILEEEPISMEEVEDAGRRERQTTGQHQVGTTPGGDNTFFSPHSIPWPHISRPPSLSPSV